ncbi:hemoglobin cathodic subunit beta-like [Acipenser ruthenus]|uniref:hemoglobin cathodic subunit beta-like n=1 Tax=Acipenser ruthenus TaxID=7906 RepID=UPI00145A31D5|nr:hemoglobin cathodic subunit beta-like [Acipenser ruthenus]
MVNWTATERKTINSLWAKVHIEEVGTQALVRLLVVYPWTQRYFSTFGNLSNPAAIAGNAKVQEHGKTVLTAVGEAIKHMDDVKSTFAKLSKLHSEKLHVDPDNFKHLGDCLSIVLAATFGHAYTPDVQATWQKLIAVIVSALSSQYH